MVFTERRQKLVYRILSYILGLLLLAFGVAFSVNSGLGVSPTNSLPYVVSAVSGIDLGIAVVIVFSVYILIQIILLRKEFKLINLLQLAFSTVFGYFVNFARLILGDFALPTYFGQLVMLAVSIVLIALGLVFYLTAELVPMPMEGMSLAISKKLPRFQFHQIKICVDSLSVATAALIALTATGGITGVREGTVISALVIGKVMQIMMKPLKPVIRSVCFDEPV